ncbi:MAG: LysM peptidoglycan-binding domain-containing protein, partial [Gammaproteobacteria bacterium]|nr:LysM peptidoglycan-binding domain-containing protein [Gammaproteobacteria bacterium]
MKRIPAWFGRKVLVYAIVVTPLVAPPVARALGLGPIELTSKLNEPFDARVPLRRVGANELEELTVKLADEAQFRRAGVERTFLLTKLRFEVVSTGASSGYIRITTHDPVPEPYLSFLVEALWPRGRVVREYAVLLDPPVYGAAIASSSRDKVKNLVEREPTPIGGTPATLQPAPPAPRAMTQTASGRASTGYRPQYGPVRQGETLWGIASAVAPTTAISVQQMMLAILRANPDAFVLDNVNALRAGSVLRIPDADEVQSLVQGNALAEVKRHQAVWEEYRQSITGGVATARPAGARESATAGGTAGGDMQASSGASSTGSTPAMPSSSEATDPLQALLGGAGQASAPGAESAVGGAADDKLNILGGERTQATDEQLSTLREQLTLASEEADARQRENDELKSRLDEAESLIGDLQRLVDLRNAELATLQEELSER